MDVGRGGTTAVEYGRFMPIRVDSGVSDVLVASCVDIACPSMYGIVRVTPCGGCVSRIIFVDEIG